MAAERHPFEDDFEKSLRDAAGLSDAELERLMSGAMGTPSRSVSYESLESGTQVEGTVVELQRQDVLVELDGKTLGVIDLEEYLDEPPPRPGTRLRAEFVRYDADRDVCVLTTKAVRTAIAWQELHEGMVLEGEVVATNKGGLTLDIKGMRAFMPVSQIDRQRVEDTEAYVGRRLRCEVTRVNREERDVVVSRRAILEREHEDERRQALDTIQQGEVRSGRVVRLTRHGAFIDLGGVDGLLHANKIARELGTSDIENALPVGTVLEVEVASVDRERGRIALEFRAVDEDAWGTIIEGYATGDEVTGWISRVDDDGAVLSLEEGLEALIPRACLAGRELDTGAIVRARITSIDPARQRVLVAPLS